MPDETDVAPKTDAEIAWKRICDLRLAEQQFNEMKLRCRTLASTWLLAAFGAMGFLISHQLSIDVPVEIVILGIGLAASTGMLLLWVLDILVYHRLLDASFCEALKLERAHPSLPQVRNNMIASQPAGQTTNYQGWFYIVTISAPLIFSGALFSYWCLRFGPWASWLAIGTITGLILVAGCVVRWKSLNPALEREKEALKRKKEARLQV